MSRSEKAFPFINILSGSPARRYFLILPGFPVQVPGCFLFVMLYSTFSTVLTVTTECSFLWMHPARLPCSQRKQQATAMYQRELIKILCFDYLNVRVCIPLTL